MKRRGAVRRSEMNQEMVLQITSMADIFTILLVFLLKSFTSGVSTITPSKNITLPEATKVEPLVENLKLEVSGNVVLLDDKPVSRLDAFQFRFDDMERNGTAKSLNAAFSLQKQKNTLKKFSSLLILADQNAPFVTVRRVLASANQAGFVDYKLVVAEDQ